MMISVYYVRAIMMLMISVYYVRAIMISVYYVAAMMLMISVYYLFTCHNRSETNPKFSNERAGHILRRLFYTHA